MKKHSIPVTQQEQQTHTEEVPQDDQQCSLIPQ